MSQIEDSQNTPVAGGQVPRPYRAATSRATLPLDEVRARIPGWGVDLDLRDRPAVPMEDFDPGATGAHWDVPERQPETWPREMSPEHGMLPAVFGTSCPPRGISGAIRKYAYTLSEGRTSHWMLLMLADRIDVMESRVEGVMTGKPDNVLGETGFMAEFKKHPIRSRVGQHRTDLKHQWMDPLITMAPYLIGGYALYRAGRALSRGFASDADFDDEPIAQHYGGTSRTYAGGADADYDARAPEDTYEAYLR
ncbi:MAG TPA: hypothetical protein VGX50_05700 [Longimicrobium sp.]|nr:hypothetical protein [Longimicrobium sp.]